MSKTNQYHLVLLTKNYGESFFHLIENNKSRLEDFFAGTVSKTSTLNDTLTYCQEIEEKIKAKSYFPYLILEKTTNNLVGFIDVKNIDWNIPKAELGAFIDTDYEGKGIITVLGNELISSIVVEHQFKKLYCRVAPRNTRSIQLVNRIGFQLEGTILRDYRTTKGELVDMNYYGKLFDVGD